MIKMLSYPPAASSQQTSDASRRQYLIFFISGNPGLIQYYETFLSTLRVLLDSEKQHPAADIHIFGQNLAGFDDDDHEPFTDAHPPHDLEFQVRTTYDRVVSMRIETGPNKGSYYDEVILMGHSVGAFIALEIFHRHMQQLGSSPHLNLKAGVLLFPTVSHMSKSSSGQRLDFIRRTHWLDRNAHRVAKSFLSLWPASGLNWFVHSVLGFSQHSADVTTRFLTSRDGVWQAIHLGKDEMRVIDEERWPEELWEIADEAAAQRHDVPKFFFYFGKNDHWVANDYRDRFIERRAEHAGRNAPPHKRGRTRMIIDEEDLPHAFCISKPAAAEGLGFTS